jgi:hypothetical protein
LWVTLPPVETGEIQQMADHQLSFQTSKDRDEIEAVMERQGAELLLKVLNGLLRTANRTVDHAHLFSPTWGGWELTGDGTKDDKWQRAGHVKLHLLGGN